VGQTKIVTSTFSEFESILKVTNILKDHTLFVWKLGTINAYLDSCICNVSPTIDHTLGFNQTVSSEKRSSMHN